MKRTILRAAAVAATLTLVACGGGQQAEPETSAVETLSATPTEEAAEDVGEVWPEGYSFDLPAGVMLGSVDIDPSDGDLRGLTYRRITLGPNSPLVSPPQSLDNDWLDEDAVSEGLAVGAQFFLEEFVDSDVLLKEYDRELEQQWFAGFEQRMEAGFQEQAAALADQPMSDHTFPVSLGALMLQSSADADAKTDADADADAATAGFADSENQVLYEASGPRFANLDVQLVDARLDGGYLELTYTSSQAFLLSLDVNGVGERIDGRIADSELELHLSYEQDGWKLTYLNSAHSWTWDHDIA